MPQLLPPPPLRVVRKKDDPVPVSAHSEIAAVKAEINKEYGEDTVRKASRLPLFTHIPTGVFVLDLALYGGLPEQTASQIVGWESSGKTTLAYLAAAEAQRKYPNSVVIWVDTDNMFDPSYARLLGADPERIELLQPESGEQAVNGLVAMAQTIEASLVILDCIASLVPQKVIDEAAEDAHVALVARLTGRMCSKMQAAFHKERRRAHRFSFLSINQYRFKVGVMFGDPRTIPGGVQQNFFHMTRVEMSNKVKYEKIDGAEYAWENQHTFKVMKSKGGTAMRQGEFQIAIDTRHPAGFGGKIEAPTVRAFGQQFGIVQGAKKLLIPEWGVEANTQAALEEKLIQDPALMLYVKQRCLIAARRRQGLPDLPLDNYLLGKIVLPPSKPVRGHAPVAPKKPAPKPPRVR